MGAVFWWNSSGSSRTKPWTPGRPDNDIKAAKEVPFLATPLSSGNAAPAGSVPMYDPVVVSPCHLAPIQEQEVSSQVDGVVQEILVELGQRVRQGDVLGRLDDRQQRAQLELLDIKAASRAGELIAKAQFDDAKSKLEMWKKLMQHNAASLLEYQSTMYQSERYAQEIQKAKEDRAVQQKELEKIRLLLQFHRFQSGLDGEVVKIYKRLGEAVRQAEPVFRVANSERLHIDGLCKVPQANLIRVGMRALVEPHLRGEQMTELAGHTAAITALAVSGDGRLLASASEDRTVLLWNWPGGTRSGLLAHPAEVYAVAMAPACGTDLKSVLLSGCADGQGRLWFLGANGAIDKSVLLDGTHDAPIRAVAVSPDGRLCATGGDDRRIALWETATGKHLYWLQQTGEAQAHSGGITSLHFTGDGCIISAGRDNTLKVWKLQEKQGQLLASQPGRSGDVSQLGVSADGRCLLFDHGEELRILDRGNLSCVGTMRSSRQERFRGLALFSPSGKLVAAAANNGRLELWKVPASAAQAAFFRQAAARGFHRGTLAGLLPNTLGFAQSLASLSPELPKLWSLHACEVRYYVPPGTGVIQCGVFAPDETVVFTGGSDKVIRAWALPSAGQVQQRLEARVTYVGNQVERGTDMVRIRAEMANPRERSHRLLPGTYASLLLYPENR
jgi:WD40 repeat protein/biotin carboxyl carrier protein